MRQAWVLATAMLCALTIGCGDSGSGDGGDDGGGDGCPPFVQIIDGSFTRSATQLSWTLEVEDMPATLTFDQTEVRPNILEYVWGIDIDTTGDGMEDWEVSAKHYRFDGPEKELPPLMGTQNALWRVQGPAGTLTGLIEATLVDTTFTFTVDIDEEAGLEEVTESSRMIYFTSYQYGPTFMDTCSDMLM